MLPAAKQTGVGVIVWGPLHGGMLGDNVLDPKMNSRSIDNQRWIGELFRDKLVKYHNLCTEAGEKESVVSLAWLLHQDEIFPGYKEAPAEYAW